MSNAIIAIAQVCGICYVTYLICQIVMYRNKPKYKTTVVKRCGGVQITVSAEANTHENLEKTLKLGLQSAQGELGPEVYGPPTDSDV